MLRGLDASSVQAGLPFATLAAAGHKFVILKGQQGNDGFDPWFERNMKAALEHGIEPFPYCFTYPLPHLDPKAQAQLFVERVHRYPEMRGRPIFIDAEWPEVVGRDGKKGWKEWKCSPAQISEWQRVNAEEVHRLSGVRPRLYTYDWWWACVRDGAPGYGYPKGADVSWAAEYPLWMAWYTNKWPNEGDKPRIPKPWSSWEFWQFDGNGGLRLPNGVDSDFCVFNGDEAGLRALANGSHVDREPEPFDIVHSNAEMIEALVEAHRERVLCSAE